MEILRQRRVKGIKLRVKVGDESVSVGELLAEVRGLGFEGGDASGESQGGDFASHIELLKWIGR